MRDGTVCIHKVDRDFGEQIEDPRKLDVTSVTRDDTSVIIQNHV